VYRLGEIAIGEGAFGVVRMAVVDPSSPSPRLQGGVEGPAAEVVAIKQLSQVFDDRQMIRRMLRELRVLHSFRHKNIIELLDVIWDKKTSNIYIVTDLYKCDLKQLISKNPAMYRSLGEAGLTSIMRQVLEGLDFLHASRVMHRDIKVRAPHPHAAGRDLRLTGFGFTS
jgi:serine/threonine protein kinase